MNQFEAFASGEAVRWCSYDCGGSPAEYQVGFTLMEQEFSLNLCAECKEKFLERGPK